MSQQMKTITVALADDHQIVRDGIKSLLENETDIEVVGEASNGIEAIELVNKLHPDVLVIDIRMPEMNGIEATKRLNDAGTSTRCMILSMHDDEEYVFRSIDSGAQGYLLKDTGKEEFLKAIRTIAKGEKYFSSPISNILVNNYLSNKNQSQHQTMAELPFQLTKREWEILGLIVEGQGNKEIAGKFGKSIRTIETHRFKIMKKLNVRNVVELINVAKEKLFR
jgi:two-component system, NarL family, response regulator DegU